MRGQGVANAAMYYRREAYSRDGQRILGRQVAGDGLFDGLLRHSGNQTYYCFASAPGDFAAFAERVTRTAGPRTASRWIAERDFHLLAEPGCLYRPDPGIGRFAWQRRFVGQTAYSLCGVTHTTCTASVMDAFGDLLLAPLESWDALVCTSRAVRTTIDHVLGEYGEYLRARVGGDPRCPAELPIIPLGVDCSAYEALRSDATRREAARKKWNADPSTVTVLFVGRLTFHAKAHPYPLFAALTEAARQTGKKVQLLLVGWFSSSHVAKSFREAIGQHCPQLPVLVVDGRKTKDLEDAWRAADIFVSLADNIQETFGLTPIEAMAAGLPSVVSDWDGYRDTVRHGVDGFRIPTLIPPVGAGEELVARYANDQDVYDRYVGQLSQSTAVDVQATTEALRSLLVDQGLRQRMGQAAKARARTMYDWSTVVAKYQHLWAELAERRAAAATEATLRDRRHPLRGDPYTVFSCYATIQLSSETRVRLVEGGDRARLAAVLRDPTMNFALASLPHEEELRSVVDQLSAGPLEVGELLEKSATDRRQKLLRGLGWLAKAGIIAACETPALGAAMGEHQNGLSRWRRLPR